MFRTSFPFWTFTIAHLFSVIPVFHLRGFMYLTFDLDDVWLNKPNELLLCLNWWRFAAQCSAAVGQD